MSDAIGQHTPRAWSPPAPGWAVVAVVAAFVAVQLVVVSSSTLWDDDEGRFARSAVEMVRSGEYLVPTLNGELRLHKPAMVYWLMAGAMRVLGPGELAVRLPSILGMAGAAVVTFLIGGRMFGGRVGLMAMVVFAGSALPFVMGGLATADGTLIFFTTLACWAVVESVVAPRAGWGGALRFVVLGLAIGGAQLTKGPVGLAVPVLMAVTLAVLLRRGRGGATGGSSLQWTRGHTMGVAAAAVAGTAIFLAWGIPANLATRGAFASEGLGRHVFHRALNPMEGHGSNDLLAYLALLPLYLGVLIPGTFPWVVHLPGAVSAMVRRHVGDAGTRAILWAWIVPNLVLFSLVVTKLPHYILPIFPAVAVAIAATLQAHRDGQLGVKDRAWLRGGVWFFVPVAVVAAVAMVVVAGGALATATGERSALWVGGAMGAMAALPLVVALLLVVPWQLRERTAAVNAVLVIAAPLTLLLTAATVVPAVEMLKAAPELARDTRAEGDLPVWENGFDQPSFIFYLDQPVGRPVRELRGEGPDVRRWLRDPEPALLVIRGDRLATLERRFGPLQLTRLFEREVVDYSSELQRRTLVVLRRGPVDAAESP
mgnify:CR=1 FL=1